MRVIIFFQISTVDNERVEENSIRLPFTSTALHTFFCYLADFFFFINNSGKNYINKHEYNDNNFELSVCRLVPAF